MIEIPITIQTTETTVETTVTEDTQEVQIDVDHVTAPVQIDFTADAETLSPGSEAQVEYADKHFHFSIPQGAAGSPGRDGVDGQPGMDGRDGQDGQDGYSPSASVTKSGSVATLTITDKSGTTQVTINDGETGADGQPGADGYSPSASVSKVGKVTTLSVTDKNGTTSAEINDGADGTSPDMSLYRTAAEQDLIDATIPKKVSDLNNDSGFITGMYIAAYGKSTYADVLAAYQANKVVYCRASSNSNPGTGNQLRMAFLAYVNSETTPTEFEFQYYRSVSTHSDSQQGDQVFVYKINSSGTWSVTTREAYTKVKAGTNLSSSYSSGVITLNFSGTIPSSASDVGAIASPASPSAGDFLVYNGTSWAAQSLSEWSGGSY